MSQNRNMTSSLISDRRLLHNEKGQKPVKLTNNNLKNLNLTMAQMAILNHFYK